jgi:membrane protein implicated in regulation of membrane protease activity
MAVALIIKKDALLIFSGLITVGSMYFLVLNEISFAIYTGMFSLPFAEIAVDLIIKISLLAIGAFFMRQIWNRIKSLNSRETK